MRSDLLDSRDLEAGEEEALELLLRQGQPSLHRYLSVLVGSTDAEDVLQDVLIGGLTSV